MADTKQLLKVRKTIKSKKPEFLQQDFHKKKRLSRKWKRPTGLHSKLRHQFKGYGRRVKQGWRSPVAIRGFHGKGLEPVIINTVSELMQVQKTQGIIIGSTVGTKKRLAIIAKAQELKLTILNIDPAKVTAKVKAATEAKLAEKKEKEEKKKKSVEEAAKKAEKKEKDKAKAANTASEETTEEEKKKQEKKAKDDVLIHSE